MFQRLKILIDPLIRDRYGPEVCWACRVLLTAIGYSWEEVPPDCSECDIAYVSRVEKVKVCKLCIRADSDLWDKRHSLVLGNVKRSNGLSYLVFQDKQSPTPAFFVNNGQIVCEKDIIFDVFWLVTGQEERHLPKDKHGFFDLSGNAFFKEQILRLALASNIGSWLETQFLNLGFPSPIPRWPHNKRAAACLSHDVDYPEVKRLVEPLRIIGRRGLKGLRPAVSVLIGSKDHWNFSSWMEVENRFGIRSAFYFAAVQGSILKYCFGVPDPFYDVKSKRFKQLFRYLSDEGFEIGLHASYLAYQSREKFGGEKQLLEQTAGQEIWGSRHHYWHLNPDDIESTLKLHEEIGLKYDTSLTHEKYLGWRRGISWPFSPFHQKERRELKILQLQTTWMDNHLFGYLKENPGDRLELLQVLIDQAAEQGGCFVVDIHDYVFDDALFPGWRNAYLWVIENLLDRSDFWIDTPGEITDHWIKRYRSVLDQSRGLGEGLQGSK